MIKITECKISSTDLNSTEPVEVSVKIRVTNKAGQAELVPFKLDVADNWHLFQVLQEEFRTQKEEKKMKQQSYSWSRVVSQLLTITAWVILMVWIDSCSCNSRVTRTIKGTFSQCMELQASTKITER